MNRLTIKDGNNHYITRFGDENKVDDKLGQLEDLEEELGVDLITLFKALKNGIIYNGVIPVMVSGNQIKIDIENKQIRWNELKGFANISDYGKTWALTKEELRNEEQQCIKENKKI